MEGAIRMRRMATVELIYQDAQSSFDFNLGPNLEHDFYILEIRHYNYTQVLIIPGKDGIMMPIQRELTLEDDQYITLYSSDGTNFEISSNSQFLQIAILKGVKL